MDLSRIKEEYKRIKAPESLRERVMNVQPVNIRPERFDRFRMIKSLSSVAACLAVAVIIIQLWSCVTAILPQSRFWVRRLEISRLRLLKILRREVFP